MSKKNGGYTKAQLDDKANQSNPSLTSAQNHRN